MPHLFWLRKVAVNWRLIRIVDHFLRYHCTLFNARARATHALQRSFGQDLAELFLSLPRLGTEEGDACFSLSALLTTETGSLHGPNLGTGHLKRKMICLVQGSVSGKQNLPVNWNGLWQTHTARPPLNLEKAHMWCTYQISVSAWIWTRTPLLIPVGRIKNASLLTFLWCPLFLKKNHTLYHYLEDYN